MNDGKPTLEAPLRRRDEARALFRNAILDAAEAVFAEKGFHGARIQDIAERARTAVGTVYNHFEDKDDVLAALLEERSEELIAELTAAKDDTGPFEARLRARVAHVLAYVQAHRAFYAIANEQGLFAGSVAPGARATSKRLLHVEKLRAAFGALLEDGVATGELEPVYGDALPRVLGGTIRAFVLSSIADRTSDVDEDASTIVDLFLFGAARRKKARERPRVPRRKNAG